MSISQFICPLPFLPGNKFVFYKWLCFISKFICTFFSPHSTYKPYHMIFVCLCLTSSLSITVSKSICVAANDIILFFFAAE